MKKPKKKMEKDATALYTKTDTATLYQSIKICCRNLTNQITDGREVNSPQDRNLYATQFTTVHKLLDVYFATHWKQDQPTGVCKRELCAWGLVKRPAYVLNPELDPAEQAKYNAIHKAGSDVWIQLTTLANPLVSALATNIECTKTARTCTWQKTQLSLRITIIIQPQ